jgi:hypothetical protein
LAHYARLPFSFFGLLKGSLNDHKWIGHAIGKEAAQAGTSSNIQGLQICQKPPGQSEVISPSTTFRMIELPIFGHLTVKADKTGATVKE